MISIDESVILEFFMRHLWQWVGSRSWKISVLGSRRGLLLQRGIFSSSARSDVGCGSDVGGSDVGSGSGSDAGCGCGSDVVGVGVMLGVGVGVMLGVGVRVMF
jgi:hypothetical protein